MKLRLVIRALKFAKEAHKGQLDDDGRPYYDAHLRQVYKILGQVTDNEEVLSAGILHDTIEDTDTTYEDLVKEFGQRVADLVMELTHEGKPDNDGYYFPRLKTAEGTLIKFADRLSNLSRMDSWAEKRQEHFVTKSRFWKRFIGDKWEEK